MSVSCSNCDKCFTYLPIQMGRSDNFRTCMSCIGNWLGAFVDTMKKRTQISGIPVEKMSVSVNRTNCGGQNQEATSTARSDSKLNYRMRYAFTPGSDSDNPFNENSFKGFKQRVAGQMADQSMDQLVREENKDVYCLYSVEFWYQLEKPLSVGRLRNMFKAIDEGKGLKEMQDVFKSGALMVLSDHEQIDPENSLYNWSKETNPGMLFYDNRATSISFVGFVWRAIFAVGRPMDILHLRSFSTQVMPLEPVDEEPYFNVRASKEDMHTFLRDSGIEPEEEKQDLKLKVQQNPAVEWDSDSDSDEEVPELPPTPAAPMSQQDALKQTLIEAFQLHHRRPPTKEELQQVLNPDLLVPTQRQALGVPYSERERRNPGVSRSLFSPQDRDPELDQDQLKIDQDMEALNKNRLRSFTEDDERTVFPPRRRTSRIPVLKQTVL